MIYVFRYAMCASLTVFWGTAGCVAAIFDRSGDWSVWVARSWLNGCMRACGVSVEAEGLENVAADQQPFVLMSNHQSVFDVAAIITTVPVPWRFVAKRELTWIPFFGWALALSKHVIIDRSNRETSVRSLRAAAQRVRQGTNVIIFPEGTRSESGSLGELKSGGFHLAIESQVPIVPATVSGSLRITPKRSLRIESGRIVVRYARAIPTEKLTIDDRGPLKEQVREVILAGFDPERQGL